MSKTTNKFSPEVRKRAVRIVIEHRNDYPSHGGSCFSIRKDWLCPSHVA